MTAIAGYIRSGVPVLIGDLLLTSPIAPEAGVSIPTLGNVDDFFGGHYSITGLWQKVAVVNDQCAVAWAGSWVNARSVLSDFKEALTRGELTTDEVPLFFRSHPDAADVSIIGFACDEKGTLQFKHNCAAIQRSDGTPAYVAGSGASILEDIRRQTDASFGNALNPHDSAYASALAVAGVLLNDELGLGAAAPTLRNFFGGGYEVACYSGGKFVKPGGIAFVLWEAELGVGMPFALPVLIVKQEYCGDFLLMRSARVTQGPPNVVAESQTHVVKPLLQSNQPADLAARLRSLALDARRFCHCIYDEKSNSYAIVMEHFAEGSTPSMKFMEMGGRLMVGMKPSLLDQIRAAVIRCDASH
jgi:hypothetical protein